MYLENIALDNIGPIDSVRITAKRVAANPAPVPLVLVGENGSGKTMVLATVADALYELANSVFRDVLPRLGTGHSYFKVTGGTNQRSGAPYGFSVLEFTSDETPLLYVEKSGVLTLAQLKEKLAKNLTPPDGWLDAENLKLTTANDEAIEKIFTKGAYCFFPANRFEAPHWINPPTAEQIAGFTFAKRFKGELRKPIAVDTAALDTFQWLLDLLLDRVVYPQANTPHQKLWVSMNKIVAAVMGVPGARLGVGVRGTLGRLSIVVERDGQIQTLAPTLQHLSAGQGVLLNLFATILRYGDMGGTSDLAA